MIRLVSFLHVYATRMIRPSISPIVTSRASPFRFSLVSRRMPPLQISLAQMKSIPCFLRLFCLFSSSHSNSTGLNVARLCHARATDVYVYGEIGQIASSEPRLWPWGVSKIPAAAAELRQKLRWCLLIDRLEALGLITAAVVPDVLPICIPGVAQALRRVPFRFKR